MGAGSITKQREQQVQRPIQTQRRAAAPGAQRAREKGGSETEAADRGQNT